MTPQETLDLLRLVTQCSPVMKLAEGTPPVWHRLLGDLPFDAACAAVLEHYAIESRFITPADIRARVAKRFGLLAPGEDEAWRAAVEVASADGVGRSLLPSAVREAYDTVGGAGGIRTGLASTVRAQFRDAYREARSRHDQGVLGRPMSELVAAQQRTEIGA